MKAKSIQIFLKTTLIVVLVLFMTACNKKDEMKVDTSDSSINMAVEKYFQHVMPGILGDDFQGLLSVDEVIVLKKESAKKFDGYEAMNVEVNVKLRLDKNQRDLPDNEQNLFHQKLKAIGFDGDTWTTGDKFIFSISDISLVELFIKLDGGWIPSINGSIRPNLLTDLLKHQFEAKDSLFSKLLKSVNIKVKGVDYKMVDFRRGSINLSVIYDWEATTNLSYDQYKKYLIENGYPGVIADGDKGSIFGGHEWRENQKYSLKNLKANFEIPSIGSSPKQSGTLMGKN